MKLSDLQRWSKAANSAQDLKPDPQPREPLHIRDLPGVRGLEDKLLLYGGKRYQADAEDAVDEVSRQLFGIISRDTIFFLPSDYDDLEIFSPERLRLDSLWHENESRYQIGDHLTDDEAMEVLADLGLDFSDERGQPLRCTKLMSRAAEAAAKGIKGKLPDRQEAGLERWSDSLEKARDAFLARKRKPG